MSNDSMRVVVDGEWRNPKGLPLSPPLHNQTPLATTATCSPPVATIATLANKRQTQVATRPARVCGFFLTRTTATPCPSEYTRQRIRSFDERPSHKNEMR
jgi:hypothetical protein